ncbi:MAG: hypothetical protein ACI4RG_12825, partial [Huintestinicola sp.]
MSDTKRNYISNICKNALFPISAAAFFTVNCISKAASVIGVVCMLCICAYFPDIYAPFKTAGKRVKAAAVLSSVGTAVCCLKVYYLNVIGDRAVDGVNEVLNLAKISVFALISLIFLSVLQAAFYTKAAEFIKEHLPDIERSERVCIAAVWVVLTVLITAAFVSSHAFYGGDIPYDLIYTSDSPDIVGGGAYFWLRHPENDIRQPSFAVFSIPFLGIPYLISLPFSGIPFAAPLLLAAVQAAMLLTAFCMIGQMLFADKLMRTAFIIFCSSTYTTLLFSIMMEQYIVGVFWLILFIFLAVKDGKRSTAAFIGTTGTLLTGAVLFPLLSDKDPVKNFKEWFRDMLNAALKLLLAFAFFGRMSTLIGAFDSLKNLMRFTNAAMALSDKMKMFTHFVSSIFFAPHAVIQMKNGSISWQLAEISDYSLIGIIIIILCIAGAVVGRKDKLSQISSCWVLFSAVLLAVIGWGAQENGMILYSLYFGWAYFVLIYKLFSAVFEKLKSTKLLP